MMTAHEKQNRVDAQDAAERVAAVGDMGRLKGSGGFDELMDQTDRGEIELDGKDGFIPRPSSPSSLWIG